MIKTTILLLLTYSISTFGQINAKSDNAFDVVYLHDIKTDNKPAYFLNGNRIDESAITTITPNKIASVNVEKQDFEFESKKYYGKILIETKIGYTPKLITLNQLKEKYINLEPRPTIFLIDDKIINADYDEYVVDENNILKIVVDYHTISTDKLNLYCIKIITKTDENVKKAREIRLRGAE